MINIINYISILPIWVKLDVCLIILNFKRYTNIKRQVRGHSLNQPISDEPSKSSGMKKDPTLTTVVRLAYTRNCLVYYRTVNDEWKVIITSYDHIRAVFRCIALFKMKFRNHLILIIRLSYAMIYILYKSLSYLLTLHLATIFLIWPNFIVEGHIWRVWRCQRGDQNP